MLVVLIFYLMIIFLNKILFLEKKSVLGGLLIAMTINFLFVYYFGINDLSYFTQLIDNNLNLLFLPYSSLIQICFLFLLGVVLLINHFNKYEIEIRSLMAASVTYFILIQIQSLEFLVLILFILSFKQKSKINFLTTLCIIFLTYLRMNGSHEDFNYFIFLLFVLMIPVVFFEKLYYFIGPLIISIVVLLYQFLNFHKNILDTFLSIILLSRILIGVLYFFHLKPRFFQYIRGNLIRLIDQQNVSSCIKKDDQLTIRINPPTQVALSLQNVNLLSKGNNQNHFSLYFHERKNVISIIVIILIIYLFNFVLIGKLWK